MIQNILALLIILKVVKRSKCYALRSAKDLVLYGIRDPNRSKY